MVIKVKHYSNSFKSTPIHQLVDDFGESNTDTSTWRPDISLVHAQSNALSGRQLVYDFPDGKDTGETVQTFVRSKGIDITEVESAEKRITTIIEDKKKDDKDKIDKAEQRKQDLKDLSDSIKSVDNSDSSTSSTPQQSS